MEEQEQTDDIRDTIGAAIDAASEPPASGPAPAPESATPVAEADEAAPPAAADGRVRDPLGRFAPAPEAARAEQVAEQTQANQQAMRPPGSWKPEAREAWANLPPTVQAEVARREQEQIRLATESASARQFTEQMSQVISPYMAMIQAEGGNPFAAVGSLLQTAAALRTAPAAQKAQLVAQMVQQYGVDIEALDNALASGPAPARGPDPVLSQVQQLVDQRLAPVQQLLSAAQQHRSQQVQSEIEQFSQKAEFFNDVRSLMADLVEVAERNGSNLSLQDAYDRACQLHPDVRQVMLARSTSSSAQGLNAAAQRAKSAAVSVRGSPTGPVGEPTPGDSLRSAIEAAIEANSR